MEKKALLDKAFIGMGALDGINQMKTEYNKPGNKYDSIMSTAIVKPNKENRIMGASNASISNPLYQKSASDELSDIYKEAKFKVDVSKIMSKAGKGIDNYNIKTKDLFEGAKKIEKSAPLKALGMKAKGYGRLTPAMAGAGAIGYGTKKIVDKADEALNPNKDEYNGPSNLAGGALAAGIIAKTLSSKDVAGGLRAAKNVAKGELFKTPIKIMKKKNKNFKTVMQNIKSNSAKVTNQQREVSRQANNVENLYRKQVDNFYGFLDRNKIKFRDLDDAGLGTELNNYISKEKDRFMNSNKADMMDPDEAAKVWAQTEESIRKSIDRLKNKKASFDIVEGSFEKIASMQYAKKVFKDHFLKKGLESIPWFAAPATVGYMMNKNIQRSGSPSEKVKEINVKVAGFNPINNLNPQAKKVIKTTVEKGAEGLGRTVFPAAITAATGRNIMNSFNKIDRDNPFNTQEGIASKIVINLDKNSLGGVKNKAKFRRQIQREIGKEVDSLIKSAVDSSLDVSDVLESVTSNLNKTVGNKKMKINKTPNIVSGIKKKQRMRG